MKCLTTAHTSFRRFITTTLAAASIAAMLVSASSPASAIAFSTSKSGIKTVSTVAWSQAGPPGTDIPSFSRFFSTNDLGLAVSFESQRPGKAVATKGISGVGPGDPIQAINGTEWDGNMYGDQDALWTNGAGAITIQFDQAVQAAGMAVQTDFFGDFTAQLELFHQGNLLAVFTETGNSNDLGDGSAAFLGFTDDFASVDAMRISILSCAQDCGDFAIDTVDIGVPNQVPEPGTLALMGSGVVGLAGLLRRKLSF